MGFLNCQIEVKGEYCDDCQKLLDEHENYNELDICLYCGHVYFKECDCFTAERLRIDDKNE